MHKYPFAATFTRQAVHNPPYFTKIKLATAHFSAIILGCASEGRRNPLRVRAWRNWQTRQI